eukprot:c28638_g1_i1 orf=285-3995(-)
MERGRGNEPDSSHTVPLYRLLCFADGLDYLLMLVGGLASAAHGASLPFFFFFFSKFIDAMGTAYRHPEETTSDDMIRKMQQYCLDFVYLGIITLLSGWLEVSFWMFTGERQSTRMRTEYLKAMLSQDVGFFDTDTSTGEIVIGISSDTILVQEAIGEKAGHYIHYTGRFFAGFAVAFSSVWKLSLLTLCVLPLIALAGGAYAYIMIELTSKSQKAYVQAGEISEEAISQVRTVYAFVGEEKAIESYARSLSVTFEIGKRSGLAKGLGVGTMYGLLFCAWALLLWYSGRLVRKGDTNGAKAFTTVLNVIMSGLALGQAAPDLAIFGKAKVAGYTILQMINRKPKINYKSITGKTLSKVVGHIELKNICFSYPSRPDAIIFQNFNLAIPAGKVVAIVGGSGSGKSTVISLIERFYDPLSGQVLLDGQDIAGLQLKWLRAQIGLVNQEPALFATSIRENILYGKEDANLEEIREAAKVSGAHKFIDQLPDQYETQVGERGTQLSGGQKQRIAIARTMLKKPAILLLDEATSALDAESERSVQEALDCVMVGRTTVIVAHRLSTVRNADMIAVVHGGRVVECGMHSELMEKGETGAYAALVRLQETSHKQPRDRESFSHNSRLSRSSFSLGGFSFRLSVHSEKDWLDTDSKKAGHHALEAPLKPSFNRLLKMNLPELPYGILGVVGAIAAGSITPLFSLALTQCLVAFYSSDQDYMKDEVRKVSLIFCGLAGVTVFIYVLEHYFLGIVGEHLTMRVRKMMFSAILHNEIGWFDQNSSSLVASRLSSDAAVVKGAIADRMSTLAQNLALIAAAFVIAFILNWRLAFVIIATYPLLIGAHVSEYYFLKGFGGDLSKAYERANMVAGEAVGNIRTIAAFCAEDKMVELFNRELDKPRRKSFLRGQMAGMAYGLSQFFVYSAYGLALWYASRQIKRQEAGFGSIMKCFMVLIITALGIAETLALAPDIAKGSQALSSVFEIIDRVTQIDPDDPQAEEVVEVNGLIELKNIHFSYSSRPDATIFKDFNLKVYPGHSLALVGASGSGKSSVIALIARFYDPVDGQVLIDGKNIKKLRLRSLRQHMGLVQQEPALFATSIYQNIAYGKDGATEAEVMEAAQAANAHNFISGLPNGYNTDVGERGVQLSGGQKQRIAIARAVVRNPSILLLDEATSALDAESEKIVQEALDRLMQHRTTVMVAHRLSTIKNADMIAVLQDGRVVEKGTHAGLLNKAGAYSHLITLQQQ